MTSIRLKLIGFVVAVLASAAVFAGPVNINTADAKTLAAELSGVGPVLAAEIVRDREANGSFASPEALMRVKGVGQHIIDMNRANILVSDPSD
jgi:competence protein ComEA